MLATTFFPLLALLAAAFSLPVDDSIAARAESSACARTGRVRIVHRPNRPAASSSAAASDAAATAEPSASAIEINKLAVQPQSSSAAAAAPTSAPAGGAPSGDATTLLNLHNSFRAKYGAGALTWNAELASFAANYGSACQFKHSGGFYGENLAAGVGGGYTVTSAFNSWGNEASKYDYNNPGFSSATGHFTQVVWKETTELGCAVIQCADGTIFSNMGGQKSTYVICEYKKPGNVVGNNNQYFRDNVGPLQG